MAMARSLPLGKRRAAVELVISHLKTAHRRPQLSQGSRRRPHHINPVLAAAGFNFHLLPRRFERLFRALTQLLRNINRPTATRLPVEIDVLARLTQIEHSEQHSIAG